jgi:hypothetical protein
VHRARFDGSIVEAWIREDPRLARERDRSVWNLVLSVMIVHKSPMQPVEVSATGSIGHPSSSSATSESLMRSANGGFVLLL